MLDITLQQTRVYREAKEEGEEEATLRLVMRLLTKRFGELSEEIRSSISGLPLTTLENLSEALLDFTTLADLPKNLGLKPRPYRTAFYFPSYLSFILAIVNKC